MLRGIGCRPSQAGISLFTGVSGINTRTIAAHFAGNTRSGGFIPAYTVPFNVTAFSKGGNDFPLV